MKTRKQVAEFINSGELSKKVDAANESSGWHFGKCDLRELMDFIYGGKPLKGETIDKLD